MTNISLDPVPQQTLIVVITSVNIIITKVPIVNVIIFAIVITTDRRVHQLMRSDFS